MRLACLYSPVTTRCFGRAQGSSVPLPCRWKETLEANITPTPSIHRLKPTTVRTACPLLGSFTIAASLERHTIIAGMIIVNVNGTMAALRWCRGVGPSPPIAESRTPTLRSRQSSPPAIVTATLSLYKTSSSNILCNDGHGIETERRRHGLRDQPC